MRPLPFLLIVLAALLFSCKEPQTATSCSGVNHNGSVENNGERPADKDPHFFRRRKKGPKAQYDTNKSSPTGQSHGKKAEKGKKKQREQTKAEKKWHLFRKKQEANNDAASKEKGNSAKNKRKQQKVRKKRSRHPQNGLWPNGHPG